MCVRFGAKMGVMVVTSFGSTDICVEMVAWTAVYFCNVWRKFWLLGQVCNYEVCSYIHK